MTDTQRATCHKIADHYGESHQRYKAIEELAELTQAIIKRMDGTDHEWDYPNEIADVMIMVEQLRYLHEKNDKDRVGKFITAKLNRQLKRMEDEANA